MHAYICIYLYIFIYIYLYITYIYLCIYLYYLQQITVLICTYYEKKSGKTERDATIQYQKSANSKRITRIYNIYNYLLSINRHTLVPRLLFAHTQTTNCIYIVK